MTCSPIKRAKEKGTKIDIEFCESMGEGKGCEHIKVCNYYLEQKKKEE
jgi:hypothetical protein